jgi:hypothetical protein
MYWYNAPKLFDSVHGTKSNVMGWVVKSFSQFHMNVDLTMMSPRMPVCNVMVARQWHQIGTNTWAVVDVAVNDMYVPGSTSGGSTWIKGGVAMACRMLPSGCPIEGMNNNYCKVMYYVRTIRMGRHSCRHLFQVTCIVNVELDSTVVPEPYLPLLLRPRPRCAPLADIAAEAVLEHLQSLPSNGAGLRI